MGAYWKGKAITTLAQPSLSMQTHVVTPIHAMNKQICTEGGYTERKIVIYLTLAQCPAFDPQIWTNFFSTMKLAFRETNVVFSARNPLKNFFQLRNPWSRHCFNIRHTYNSATHSHCMASQLSMPLLRMLVLYISRTQQAAYCKLTSNDWSRNHAVGITPSWSLPAFCCRHTHS